MGVWGVDWAAHPPLGRAITCIFPVGQVDAWQISGVGHCTHSESQRNVPHSVGSKQAVGVNRGGGGGGGSQAGKGEAEPSLHVRKEGKTTSGCLKELKNARSNVQSQRSSDQRPERPFLFAQSTAFFLLCPPSHPAQMEPALGTGRGGGVSDPHALTSLPCKSLEINV